MSVYIYIFDSERERDYCIQVFDSYLAACMRGLPEVEQRRLLSRLILFGPFTHFTKFSGPDRDRDIYAHIDTLRGCFHEARTAPDEVAFVLEYEPEAVRDEIHRLHTEIDGNQSSAIYVSQAAMEMVKHKKDFVAKVQELAAILEKEPVLSPTGQTEPMYERPRTYGDVEKENANKLAILPRYTARCTLVQDGQRVEHTIKTLPGPEVTEGGRKRAQEIRERSRRVYGRDRKKVEQAIEERLQIKAAVPSDGQEQLGYYEEG